MNFKRLLMVVATACLMQGAAWAEDGVIVTLHSGQTIGFTFAQRPVIVTGTDLEMRTADGTCVRYLYADVAKVTWGPIDDIQTGITDTRDNTRAGNIVFHITADGISADGMADGEHLSVYTVDGRLAGSARSQGGSASITLPTGKAVYIVRTASGVSCKIARQ